MKRRRLVFLLTATNATSAASGFSVVSNSCNKRKLNINDRVKVPLDSISSFFFFPSCSYSYPSSLCPRLNSKSNNNNGEEDDGIDAFSRNEFSRIIFIDRIFQNKRRTRTLNQLRQQRDHSVSVKAGKEERGMLAKRFELKEIKKLTANLSLRPAIMGMIDGGSGDNFPIPVEVEGIIEANLTQTCVRTGEDFDVEVEIPLNAIVRPIESSFDDIQNLLNEKKVKKKKKKNVIHQNKKVHNMEDVFDLQSAIQQAELFDGTSSGGGDGSNGSHMDIVENEGIYSSSCDQMDIGELISQTLYLQLDWYPKKPGSDPMDYEMSTIA